MKNFQAFSRLLFLTLFIAISIPALGQWQKLEKGLWFGEFRTTLKSAPQNAKIVVLKIDPHLFRLKVLCAARLNHENLTADAWAKKYSLVAVINAGMFNGDGKTHTGYLKNFKYLNNSQISKKYLSVAAFNPVNPKDAPFRIFDLDVTQLKQIRNRYQTVIQNLRLIKRPGINRWGQKTLKWSEAALGEDKAGNALFIFSRAPFSMHDFNEILLKLPLNLVCAQHLEGGPEASFYLNCNEHHLELDGSYETGFNENNLNTHFWPLPNVLGVVPK